MTEVADPLHEWGLATCWNCLPAVIVLRWWTSRAPRSVTFTSSNDLVRRPPIASAGQAGPGTYKFVPQKVTHQGHITHLPEPLTKTVWRSAHPTPGSRVKDQFAEPYGSQSQAMRSAPSREPTLCGINLLNAPRWKLFTVLSSLVGIV